MDKHALSNGSIEITGKSFCFTGRARMKRSDMEAMVTSRGGEVHKRVTRGTDYLVVGGKGSPGWRYEGFGNKILRARYIQFTGGKVVIISEEVLWEGVVVQQPKGHITIGGSGEVVERDYEI